MTMTPTHFPLPALAASAALLSLLLPGCDDSGSRSGGTSTMVREQPAPAAHTAAAGGPIRQRQMEFLNRIRAADPEGRTIERALLNEQNELGLILGRSVAMDAIPQLMRTMLTQMAREFPGEDLTVLAYAPSDPPRKIGTARLNARTRDMSYTPEQP